ncbi:hypothetical protein J4426_01595 [Candidatus Woesearchaeota archaeon]|nr:hypothetical protein [Candidatus Woesearchaeota archaeon]
MNLNEEEVRRSLNLFRSVTSEKDKAISKKLTPLATSLRGYSDRDFNEVYEGLKQKVNYQSGLLRRIGAISRAREVQIREIIDLDLKSMTLFLTELLNSMGSKEFREEEFGLQNRGKLRNVNAEAKGFAEGLSRRKKIERIRFYSTPDGLKNALRIFLLEEYGIDKVEDYTTRINGILSDQHNTLNDIIPPRAILQYMTQNGIEQARDLPEDERKKMEVNHELCTSLARSIDAEERIGVSFRRVVLLSFKKTKIVEGMVGKAISEQPSREEVADLF